MLPVNIEPNEYSPKMLLNNGLSNRVHLLKSLNSEEGLFPNRGDLDDTLNEFTNTFGKAPAREVVGVSSRNHTGIIYSLFRFHEIGDMNSSFMEMFKKLEETYKDTFIYPEFISKSDPLTLSRYFSLCNIYGYGETRRNGEPLDGTVSYIPANINLSTILPSLFYLSKTGNKYAEEVFENLSSYIEYIPVGSYGVAGIGVCSKNISKGSIADIKDRLDEHLHVMDLHVGQMAREAVFLKRYGINPSILNKTHDEFTESYNSLIGKFVETIGDPESIRRDSLFMPKITKKKSTYTDFFNILGKMVERSGKEEALELLKALKFATNSDIYMSIILQDEDKWDCPDIAMTTKRLNIFNALSRSALLDNKYKLASKYRIEYKGENEKRLYAVTKLLSLDDGLLDSLPTQWIIGSLV